MRKAIPYRAVVDLSRVIHPGIPRWPGDPLIRFRAVSRLDPDGYFLRRFSMGEHTGTHMNALVSFHRHGESMEAYPAESLVAPAVVIDVRASAQADTGYALDTAAVLRWERQHGKAPPGSIVLENLTNLGCAASRRFDPGDRHPAVQVRQRGPRIGAGLRALTR